MRLVATDPPRVFEVGHDEQIRLTDCGRLELAADEQVTLVTPAGGEYDVVRKSWGFYATPSLNGRLRRFGFRTALVENRRRQYFVLLVERGHERAFEGYVDAERLRVVAWLDDQEPLAGPAVAARRPAPAGAARCVCGSDRFSTVFVYEAPPPGEVAFGFAAVAGYHREVVRCQACGHFRSLHHLDDDALYDGDYVTSTYGGDGLRTAFARIADLPPERSDNAGRVRRILDFAGQHFRPPLARPTILDVGSGLCVFLHRMKAAGWTGTALDRDPRLVAHAREVAGVAAVHGELGTAAGLTRYDVVTFNKVLEHVKEPATMLAASRPHLAPGGFVYVELPDGEAAVHEGPGREEFFIDHHHVFSAASLALLAVGAGFSVRVMERLREPSTKLTLRAFLVPS
jgi:2-polyprenyl-3-methyl-5-hydroxy-6-metoxy-1,4-benzoquinol methylase